MNHSIDVGPSPAEEPCASVGQEDYVRAAGRECSVWMRMLRRLFPVPDNCTARFSRRGSPHDFGTYYEVVVKWQADDEVGGNYAYYVEEHLPGNWDGHARYELAWLELRDNYRDAVTCGRITEDEVPMRFRGDFPLLTLPQTATFAELLAQFPLR